MSSEKNLNPSKLKKGKKGEKNILLTFFKIIAVVVIFILQLLFMAFMYTTTKGIYVYARYAFEIIKIIQYVTYYINMIAQHTKYHGYCLYLYFQ